MKNLIKICLLALCLVDCNIAHAQSEATFYTSMGTFSVILTDTLTPITVDSFKVRVSQKFYDGLIFHRVIKNFVIQGGDPLGNGTGGPGYVLPDEFNPTLKNVAGALAMANAGPNTGGSQFYVNLVNNSSLNGKYTVFGMVNANFTVVQSIGNVPTDANDRPLTDVVMDSVRITKYPALVSNLTAGITMTVYPNPGMGMFHIGLPEIATKVEVVNTRGQVIYAADTKGALNIDLHNQPAGLYIVHISNMLGTADSKIIIQ